MNTLVEIAEIVFQNNDCGIWILISNDAQFELLNEGLAVNSHENIDATIYNILLIAAMEGEL